jgi:hypothetical protein
MLVAHSVTLIQLMLDMCSQYANDFDLIFNSCKSAAMRIGKRYSVTVATLVLSSNVLKCVTSVKYLIVAAEHFRCDYDHVKHKYYKMFNTVYYRSKADNSELVSPC